MKTTPWATQYLIIRTKDILGYTEHLGPILSTPQEIKKDANRLYGKSGYAIAYKPHSEATDKQKQEAQENTDK